MYLIPNSLKSVDFQFSVRGHPAPKNSYLSDPYTYDFSTKKPEAIAYQLIKEFYLWFGLAESEIPYIKYENDVGMVDIKAIKENG